MKLDQQTAQRWLLRLSSAVGPWIAVAAAILTLNLLSWAFGASPLHTLATAVAGSWGTAYGIGQVLFKATPLLLAGLSVDIALRAGLFNIGVEGQIAIGSLVGTMAALVIPASWPAIIAIPFALGAAAVAGGAWAAIAGWMRVRFGAHEVITTIMLNRIADAIIALVMTHWLAMHGTVRTRDLPANTQLTHLDHWFPSFSGSASSTAVLLAVGVTLAAFWWLTKTPSGRQTCWIGINETACASEGIPVGRRKIIAMTVSGAVASMAFAGMVLGYKGYFEVGLGAGVGFAGIAVAFLGRGSLLGLVFASLLFGTLAQAGLVINATVPREAMGILQAVVIVVAALASGAVFKAKLEVVKQQGVES